MVWIGEQVVGERVGEDDIRVKCEILNSSGECWWLIVGDEILLLIEENNALDTGQQVGACLLMGGAGALVCDGPNTAAGVFFQQKVAGVGLNNELVETATSIESVGAG